MKLHETTYIKHLWMQMLQYNHIYIFCLYMFKNIFKNIQNFYFVDEKDDFHLPDIACP